MICVLRSSVWGGVTSRGIKIGGGTAVGPGVTVGVGTAVGPGVTVGVGKAMICVRLNEAADCA